MDLARIPRIHFGLDVHMSPKTARARLGVACSRKAPAHVIDALRRDLVVANLEAQLRRAVHQLRSEDRTYLVGVILDAAMDSHDAAGAIA
jgi:hypothetical protein